MSKILAVFGATGQQGSSVIKHVLSNPLLSQQFKIRAITRDTTSGKTQALISKNIEVVQGDVANLASLQTALSGVHTIFGMTTPSFSPNALEEEFQSAKNIADAAIAVKATYLIFSTLPGVTEISGGKYTAVTPFDAKAKAEKYIKGLSINSAFVSLGSFMENFSAQPFLAPKLREEDEVWVLKRHNSKDLKFPLLDAVSDSGKFVCAILQDPEKFEGKRICAAEGMYSLEEICGVMSKTTGKKVIYEQVTEGEFRESLPPFIAGLFVEAFSYGEEFGGYFGPETEEVVREGRKVVGAKLTTLEEYFEKFPLKLEA